jgi:hypothetical protein
MNWTILLPVLNFKLKATEATNDSLRELIKIKISNSKQNEIFPSNAATKNDKQCAPIFIFFGPVYTIPEYFSYRINFYSEVKKQGCLHYAASLCCQLMSFTVAMETSSQYTKIY